MNPYVSNNTSVELPNQSVLVNTTSVSEHLCAPKDPLLQGLTIEQIRDMKAMLGMFEDDVKRYALAKSQSSQNVRY